MNSITLPEHKSALSPPRPRLSALLVCLNLAVLWFLLIRQLSYEWTANEQYSYGWFVPFFAVFLLWLRWEDRPHSFATPEAKGLRFAIQCGAILLLALLFPIRLFEVANPDWRPLSWSHAFAVVGLTLIAVRHLGGIRAVCHFLFPICFILVAVPWISPVEGPLVRGLMRLVATVATEVLTLVGIPAQLEGSVIRVSSGMVGVSEACSGVRSLQTSFMIGLLFGELKRLTTARRVALVFAALTIALVSNFARAFFLVWIAATRDLAAVDRWHDVAGYAIVGAVVLGTITIAAALGEGRISPEPKSSGAAESVALSTVRFPRAAFLVASFALLLFIEVAVEGWYRWHERDLIATAGWTANWPETAPGFHAIPIDNNVRSTLRYDSGREATWQARLVIHTDERSIRAACTMFFFRWNAGSASILRARAHRPDVCLPNTGWRMLRDSGVRSHQVAANLALPFRHFEFVNEAKNGHRVFAHAFFCQHEERLSATSPDRFDVVAGQTQNWDRSDRLEAIRNGRRNQGQQVLEVVILTTAEVSGAAAEENFARLAPELIKPLK